MRAAIQKSPSLPDSVTDVKIDVGKTQEIVIKSDEDKTHDPDSRKRKAEDTVPVIHDDESDDQDDEDDDQDDDDDHFRDALKASWYIDYVVEGTLPYGARLLKTFKRRFKMPFTAFKDIVKEAQEKEWFPDYEENYAFGQKNVTLDMLILTSIRFLGRGCPVDEISGLSGISEKAIRKFYKAFTEACDKHSYPI